jgi:hypothetical protein
MSTASAPSAPTGGSPGAGSTPAPPSPPPAGSTGFLPEAPPTRPGGPPASANAGDAGTQPASAQEQAQQQAAHEHEWLQKVEGGKYRTFADYENAATERLKTMHGLQTKLGIMQAKSPLLEGPPLDPETGLPGAYQFEPSEEMAAMGLAVDPEDPTLTGATAWGHKWSIPQKAMQELFATVYEPQYRGDMKGLLEREQGELLAHFGSVEAQADGLNQVAWRLMDLMGGEQSYPAIRRAINASAETAIFMHNLVKAIDGGGVSLLGKGGGGAAASTDSEQQILEMRNVDPDFKQPGNRERYDRWLAAEAARQDAAGHGKGYKPITEMRAQERR